MIHFLPGLQQTTQAASVGWLFPPARSPTAPEQLFIVVDFSKKKLHHPIWALEAENLKEKLSSFFLGWKSCRGCWLDDFMWTVVWFWSIWTIGSKYKHQWISYLPTYLPLKWGVRTKLVVKRPLGLWWGAPLRKGQGSDQMSMMFTMRFRKIEKKTQPQRQRPAKTNASMQLVMWQQPTNTCFFVGRLDHNSPSQIEAKCKKKQNQRNSSQQQIQPPKKKLNLPNLPT